MTREEAIKAIKEHCYFNGLNPTAKEALDIAINATENVVELSKSVSALSDNVSYLMEESD